MDIKVLKKILIKFVVLLLMIATITSCTSAQEQEKITIRLSGWQSNTSEQQLLREVLKNFETEHPGVEVKYEVINDQYMDVIKTRLIGDSAPDVFYLDAFEAPLLMKNNVLEPLDRYITPEFDLGDFLPTMLNAFRDSGKTYGLPKDFSTLVLFYNKEYFDFAGINQPPKTWQELQKYSQKLTIDTNKDNRIDRYGLGISPELARQYFMIKAYGGKIIDRQGYAAFASPQSLKGLELIVNQYRRDRTAVQPSDVGASSGSDMFGRGKVAMVIEGNWAIPYLKDTFPQIEFGTTEIPKVNGKKGTMAYTVAYVMNKKSQHKDTAWQLISYLTGKEGMKAWAKEGSVLPSRQSVLADLKLRNNPLYQPFVRGADYATIWQAGENLPIIFTNFNNQFISALIGQQSLREAMVKAQNTANKEMTAAS